MLKKTITYTDFDGNEVTEDFYFHMSKADLVEMELSHKDGLQKKIERIVEAQDGKAIMEEFKNLLLGSYGQKSPDGRRFVKSQELQDEFKSSPAYDVIFMELVTDSDKAAAFVNGIIPTDLGDDVAKMPQKYNGPPASVVEAEQNIGISEVGRLLTQAEVEEMDSDELKSGLATRKYRLS